MSNGDSPQPQIFMKDLLPHELAAIKQVKRVGFTEEQALQAIGGMCFGASVLLCICLHSLAWTDKSKWVGLQLFVLDFIFYFTYYLFRCPN